MTHDSGLAPFNAPTVASSTPLLAFRACPVCSVPTQATELQRLRDFQFFTDGDAPRVDLIDVQCTHCFACYKNPTYTDEGMRVLFAKAARSYGAIDPMARATEQATFVKAYALDAASVLDYGCGDGSFLAALDLPSRYGIELDASLRQAALTANTVGAFASSLAAFHDILPAQIDVMTCWHALEHVADPIGVLAGLRMAATMTTRLVVEVPVLEQATASADLCGFFTPQHVTHFSRQSLLNVLGRSGWEAMHIVPQRYNGVRVVCRPLSLAGQTRGNFLAHGVIPDAFDTTRALQVQTAHAAAIGEVTRRLHARTHGKSLTLWGAGLHTELLYQWAGLNDHMPTVLFDTDPAKQGARWRGVRIITPTGWEADDWEFTRLVISSYGSQAAIHAAAVALDIPRSAIVTLYDDPVAY